MPVLKYLEATPVTSEPALEANLIEIIEYRFNLSHRLFSKKLDFITSSVRFTLSKIQFLTIYIANYDFMLFFSVLKGPRAEIRLDLNLSSLLI